MAISPRRFLLQVAITPTDSTNIVTTAIATNPNSTNIILMLAVLFCILICALGFNPFIRCALRLSGRPNLSIPTQLARTAAHRRAIHKLPLMIYSSGLKLGTSGSECAICLAEIGLGERVRFLPKCGHGFHMLCVDRWLVARPTCPTCRQCLFATSQKSAGCSGPEQTDRTGIEPLEPEGLVTSFRI